MTETLPCKCKALVQQGARKNLCCERPPLANGYCVYHKRNYEYEVLLASGKTLCGMFFRGCNVELTEADITREYKHCIDCRTKKSGKEFPCKQEGCTFHTAREGDYCRKHIRRLLYDNEKKENIVYCDIARGCFNQVISKNTCSTCINKEKQVVAVSIKGLREKHEVVTSVSSHTQLHIQQEAKPISIAELWRCIQKNAYARGLLFTITESDFEKCAIQPCHYCGFSSMTRLNGIDRIDNNKGYIAGNCMACCTMCNIIKNVQHPLEFLDKVDAIYNYYTTKTPFVLILEKWSSYLSSTVRDTYNGYKQKCKQREIEFILSESEYTALIQGICYLCGIANQKSHANGIDRLDSRIRCYSIENSKSCCGHCNVMKGILSYADFIEKCIQINKYACNRSIFAQIPIYSASKCRNEFYTAEDIYQMMHNGQYMNYIEWCREKEKSSEFVSAMNHICHSEELTTACIVQIRSELDKERSRQTSMDDLTDKTHIQSSTVYSYLTQGKVDFFKDWYAANYNKTTLFDEQFDILLAALPTLTREQGIDACKKFMYDEKNRRIAQERRDRQKKVLKYSNSSTASPVTVNKVIYPTAPEPEYPIVQKVKHIQEQKGYIKVELPKQWKSKQIYKTIQANEENQYKAFCEEHNTVPNDWMEQWTTFVLAVKGKTFEQSEPILKAFVENLRRLRHNKLCAKDPLEREERQQWPAITVVRAFLEGKLDAFKAFTEAASQESIEDPKWTKRWTEFVKTLESNRANEETLKGLCSKFMAAQRIKKYRRAK